MFAGKELSVYVGVPLAHLFLVKMTLNLPVDFLLKSSTSFLLLHLKIQSFDHIAVRVLEMRTFFEAISK